jgi:cytochrome b6-f complex iron-sulfur subunit
MERKDFIKKFAFGGSILLTAPMIFSACSKDEIQPPEEEPGDGNSNEIVVNLDEAAYADLKNVGGFAYKGDIIIFRTSETSYLALSKLCTHSQCTITYNHTTGNMPCPCHGSTFTTDGAVTKGPAASNLKKYSVTKDGNLLKIT